MGNNVNLILQTMIEYFNGDVKRINHAVKVYTFAKSIGLSENLSSEKLYILEVSSILHDIGIKISEQKYNSSIGKYQEIEGPKVARKLLKDFDIQEYVVDRICYLIGNHHTYSKIDDKNFQILIEADFLVNIFEENMNKQQIESIYKKYFKTQLGTKYLENMYLK